MTKKNSSARQVGRGTLIASVALMAFIAAGTQAAVVLAVMPVVAVLAVTQAAAVFQPASFVTKARPVRLPLSPVIRQLILLQQQYQVRQLSFWT